MTLLAIPSCPHHCHDEVLGGHEGQLLLDMPLNHLGVDHQALHDVLHGGENGVCSEEGLSQCDPSVGRVIQGPLHPLGGLLF